MTDDKFCEQCDSKGVRHKKECPLSVKYPEKKESVGDGNFVSREDFEKSKRETDEKLDRILNIISAKEEVEAEVTEPFTGNVGNLPSEFQAVFMKNFDPNDGFTAEYDPIENTFAVIVPPKFSNSIPANMDYYKVDRRMKKLEIGNPLGTIDAWCKKVVANLRYNKNIQTK